jgi:hypothetical protein
MILLLASVAVGVSNIFRNMTFALAALHRLHLGFVESAHGLALYKYTEPKNPTREFRHSIM